jgi:hypothetical protein
MFKKYYINKNKDELTVSWKKTDSYIDYKENGFEVELAYKGHTVVDQEILNKNRCMLPFSLLRSGGVNIKGSFRWQEENNIPFLELDLDYPESKTIRLYPDENPIPSPPVPLEYLDLFPYVYICPCAQSHEEYLKDRFVTYEKTVETKGGEGNTPSFYETLKSLKEAKKRAEMEDESVKFINGEDPYQGQFLSGFEVLESILKYYEPLGRWLLKQLKVDFESLSVEVEKHVGNWDKIITSTATPEYEAEKERLWETLFALNITLEYDFKILEKIIITLVTAKMLEKIADIKSAVLPDKTKNLEIKKLEGDKIGSESEEATEDNVKESSESIVTIEKKSYFNLPSPEELYRWAHATILLPDTIFPMPPFQDSKNCESDEIVKPSITPYAIGELHMVQYCLRGYQLGEVSHIENILKGECKEVTERQFMQLKESELLGQNLQDDKSAELENRTADFLNEVNRTLNPRITDMDIKDYETSYSDSTIVQKGGWTVTEKSVSGSDLHGFEDKEGFAKDVVSRTVSRISQKVNRTRMKSSLSESEEKVTHHFDNIGGESNILGVYRWLNKVYSLRTVNIGNRIVLELKVEKPAASFLKNECQCHEIRLEKPISPAELGLKSYKNISESEGEGYYLDFLARYDIPELLSPPLQSKAVTVALESAKPFCTRSLEIPEGYEAETAKVSIYFINENSKAKIMVGNAVEEYSAGTLPTDLNLEQPNVEQTMIPISIIFSNPEKIADLENNADPQNNADSQKSADPQKDAENTVNYYLANIEVKCKRTDNLFKEWQLLTFRKIMQGYKKQKAEYYQQIEHQRNKILPISPHLSRVVERQQLKKNAFSLFWDICLERVGINKVEEEQTSKRLMNKPKYFQFFRNSLEWEGMAYYIHPAWDDSENDDFFMDIGLEEILRTEYFEQSDFLNFLKASSARILLPVKPEFTFKFLYFLSSGLVWTGNDDLVPATSLHELLVNEIKAMRECKAENKAEEAAWEVTLPTPMVVLQADSHLPKFEEYFGNSSKR